MSALHCVKSHMELSFFATTYAEIEITVATKAEVVVSIRALTVMVSFSLDIM